MGERVVDKSQGLDESFAQAIGAASRKPLREATSRDVRNVRKRKSMDKFYVPAELIPKGWCVEWKRKSCYGKPEDPDYHMDLADGGWKIADPKIYHSLVPPEHEGKTVERGGMVLMTRPKHLKDEAERLDREEAIAQVRDKLSEIGMTGQGEMKRVVTNFQRSYDSGRSVPDDNGETEE